MSLSLNRTNVNRSQAARSPSPQSTRDGDTTAPSPGAAGEKTRIRLRSYDLEYGVGPILNGALTSVAWLWHLGRPDDYEKDKDSVWNKAMRDYQAEANALKEQRFQETSPRESSQKGHRACQFRKPSTVSPGMDTVVTLHLDQSDSGHTELTEDWEQQPH